MIFHQALQGLYIFATMSSTQLTKFQTPISKPFPFDSRLYEKDDWFGEVLWESFDWQVVKAGENDGSRVFAWRHVRFISDWF